MECGTWFSWQLVEIPRAFRSPCSFLPFVCTADDESEKNPLEMAREVRVPSNPTVVLISTLVQCDEDPCDFSNAVASPVLARGMYENMNVVRMKIKQPWR